MEIAREKTIHMKTEFGIFGISITTFISYLWGVCIFSTYIEIYLLFYRFIKFFIDFNR